jgi:hypothetical protein
LDAATAPPAPTSASTATAVTAILRVIVICISRSFRSLTGHTFVARHEREMSPR